MQGLQSNGRKPSRASAKSGSSTTPLPSTSRLVVSQSPVGPVPGLTWPIRSASSASSASIGAGSVVGSALRIGDPFLQGADAHLR